MGDREGSRTWGAWQDADGMSVARIAEDWSVGVEQVEEILHRSGPPEPEVTPVTTIAWWLAHLHHCFAGAWE